MLTQEERLALTMAVRPIFVERSQLEFSELHGEVHRVETVDDLILFVSRVIEFYEQRVERAREASYEEW